MCMHCNKDPDPAIVIGQLLQAVRDNGIRLDKQILEDASKILDDYQAFLLKPSKMEGYGEPAAQVIMIGLVMWVLVKPLL